MAARDKQREPRVASLLASVLLHALAGLGVAASSWWWSAPALEMWKTHTVTLVDAPLSLQAALPPAPPPPPPTKVVDPKPEPPQTPEPPKQTPPPEVAEPKPEPPKAPAPPKPPPPKAAEKKPEPPQAPEPPKQMPPPKTEAKKPKPPKQKPKVEAKQPAPQAASSREARSAINALRKRQAKLAKEEQRAKAQQQRTASARVAALRDQLARQESVGGSAVMAAGVQLVRLNAYQAHLRDKIIETWILPLSPEQRRDLQATAQFQVMRNGDVTQLELVHPSGNALFDASLLRAIRRASPLPSLPDDYPLNSLEVVMRFRADA